MALAMFVVLLLGWYLSMLIRNLGRFMVWPSGKIWLSLNPLYSGVKLSGMPKSHSSAFRWAGIVTDLLVLMVLPLYFQVGGLLGALLTAIAFSTFFRLVVFELLFIGVLLPVNYLSTTSNMFGKDFRVASLAAIVAVLIVFSSYTASMPAFLHTFLP